jgi:hypothetical protein
LVKQLLRDNNKEKAREKLAFLASPWFLCRERSGKTTSREMLFSKDPLGTKT